MRRRYTGYDELTRLLLRAGFVRHKVGERWATSHEVWYIAPRDGRRVAAGPLFVLLVKAPHPDAIRQNTVAHGFAYGGPRETDEHWQGRFPSLTAAADWATAHGRGAAA